MLVFTLLCAAQLWLLEQPAMLSMFPSHDYILTRYAGEYALSTRVLFLSFFVAFSLFTTGTIGGRLVLMADLILHFLLICMLFDLVNTAIGFFSVYAIPLDVIQIIVGVFGFGIFAFKLMERGTMPIRLAMRHKTYRVRKALLRLVLCAVAAATITMIVAIQDFHAVRMLRDIALLGGLGPGVFLFLPLFVVMLYALGRLDQARHIDSGFQPPVTVIVPAHNEAYIIVDTIKALDRAAARYVGTVTVLIMNNASTDDTAAIASGGLRHCEHVTGRVIDVDTPGKANALNEGLWHTETEFVVRVDADTLLAPDALRFALENFEDPEVGVVGGIPVPPGGGRFDRARRVEVLLKHGFYSVAFSAIDCLVGVPGMFVVYRTAHPRQLGGFARGVNGEDTDMSVRIAELGLKSMVDPRVSYISEVPASYRHMREQRLRWFRSVFHVSARCFDLVDSAWPTLRGKLILPYMLINSARRAMMLPLVSFGLLQLAIHPGPGGNLYIQSILAVFLGAPMIVAVIAIALNRQFGAILALPEYILFRAVRAYFTMESMMTIIIAGGRYNEVAPERIERLNPFREYLDSVPERERPAAVGEAGDRAAGSMAGMIALFAAATVLFGATSTGQAQAQSALAFDQEVYVARQVVPPDVLESGVDQDRLLPSVNSESYLTYRARDDGSLLLRGGFIMSRFAENAAYDRYGFDAAAEYRRDLDQQENWQLRLQGDLRSVAGEDGHIFTRQRLGALVNKRHSPEHSSRGRLVVGRRDQNESNTFSGFDQTEWRAELGHAWRPRRDRLFLLGTAYLETVDADDDRFTYDGIGVWGLARVPVADRLEVTARLTAYRREYEDAFSASIPESRRDTRLWPRASVDYFLTDRWIAFGEVGYDINVSNIETRDYDGITAMLGARFSGSLGEFSMNSPDDD